MEEVSRREIRNLRNDKSKAIMCCFRHSFQSEYEIATILSIHMEASCRSVLFRKGKKKTTYRFQCDNSVQPNVWQKNDKSSSFASYQEVCFSSQVSINSPFPNYPWPHFQNESWCLSFHMIISFHLHANKTHFHKNG